jgi:hypothetical protein
MKRLYFQLTYPQSPKRDNYPWSDKTNIKNGRLSVSTMGQRESSLDLSGSQISRLNKIIIKMKYNPDSNMAAHTKH